MILYAENPKDYTKKQTELIMSSVKLQDIKKPVAFLHTNNSISEKEIKLSTEFCPAEQQPALPTTSLSHK